MGAARLKIIDLDSGNQPILSEDGDFGIASTAKFTIISKYGANWKNSGIDSNRIPTRKPFFARSCNGTRNAWRSCAECSRWHCGKNRQDALFWRATAWESNRFTSLVKGKIFFRLRAESHFCPSGDRTPAEPSWTRLLSLAELCACPWTLVEGIEKLPPGHWLEWSDGKISSDAYWKLPFTQPSNYTLETAKEELDRLLQQSVREHMIRMFRWGFGSAAEWIRRPSCTTPREPPLRS